MYRGKIISRNIGYRFWDGKEMIYHGYKHVDCSFHGLFVCEGDTIPLQYTGLKDKNKQDAYEGDIVQENDGRIYLVKWIEDEAGFVLFQPPLHYRHFKDIKVMKIIGNIYQNKELLGY